MTDKEMLLHLISKLDLRESKSSYIGDDEYYIDNDYDRITIGRGQGYIPAYVQFQFGSEDNLISHSVWGIMDD